MDGVDLSCSLFIWQLVQKHGEEGKNLQLLFSFLCNPRWMFSLWLIYRALPLLCVRCSAFIDVQARHLLGRE